MADPLPLITVLGGMLTVPCVIALTQGSEKATKAFAAAGALVGLWLGLYPYVPFLKEITSDTLYQVLGILALVLAVIIASRLKHQIMGTLIVTAGGLIALGAFGIVR